jgi:acetyl-CoA C-acetyltransferase
VVAERYQVSRADQDEFAYNSHRKAAEAINAGRFQDEILPVAIPQKKGDPIIFAIDEPVRFDASLASLAKLRPAFKKDGTVTAGNAPPVNDGATEPEMLMMAPQYAIEKLLKKTGWTVADVDLYEINEAFAVQLVALIRELGLDPARVNVNGGAIALGHAIGSSGARVLTTLLYEMKRRDAKRGVASLCLGGGNAVALAVER